MADYQAIVRQKPEVRQFIRNRKWVHRGEVVTYGANIACNAFSTDEAGFRHSVFGGKAVSVGDCVGSNRYGLVLGSSHLYGFGLAGNANTIPSLLAERFGFPFANVSMPEASSRNLFSLLAAFTTRAHFPPAAVVHMSGGDFTSFCFTAIADPVFGSPNLKQFNAVAEERHGSRPADPQFQPLLAFTSLWTRSIVKFCSSRGIPAILANDTTFFEKREPSAYDVQCRLGIATSGQQERQFATHRRYFEDFCARRATLAKANGVSLAGPGTSNDYGFVDEFHYDGAATRALSDELAAALAPLLR